MVALSMTLMPPTRWPWAASTRREQALTRRTTVAGSVDERVFDVR